METPSPSPPHPYQVKNHKKAIISWLVNSIARLCFAQQNKGPILCCCFGANTVLKEDVAVVWFSAFIDISRRVLLCQSYHRLSKAKSDFTKVVTFMSETTFTICSNSWDINLSFHEILIFVKCTFPKSKNTFHRQQK